MARKDLRGRNNTLTNKNMFFSIDPDIDIKIAFALLAMCTLFSIWLYKKTKRGLLALVVLSTLCNSVFLIYGDSWMYGIYSIKWLHDFSLFVWPAVNTILLFTLARNKLFIVWWLSFVANSLFALFFALKPPFLAFRLLSYEIWPAVNFVLFLVVMVKILRDPKKFFKIN